jgi:hypothetical protein
MSGLKVASRKGVDLQVGDALRIDFRLEAGGVTEVVEVTGGAPLITTEITAVGAVIENKPLAHNKAAWFG